MFCSRYWVKEKRVLGATQSPVQGQGAEGGVLKQASFPARGPQTRLQGTDLGPQ